MTVTTTTRNVDLAKSTKALSEQTIISKLEPLFTKSNAEVIIEKEGRKMIVTIFATAYGTTMKAKGEDLSLQTAINRACDTLKRKFRKAKTRTLNGKRGNTIKPADASVSKKEKEENISPIINRSIIHLETMTEDEAVFKAEMTGKTVFAYISPDGNTELIVSTSEGFEKISLA